MVDGSPQSQTDHDILITLVETVKNNNSTLIEKIQDVKDKVQEVNDGISAKVNDHETRLKVIESTHALVKPEESFKKMTALLSWKDQFEFKWKFILTGALILGGFIEYLISNTYHLFNIFSKH